MHSSRVIGARLIVAIIIGLFVAPRMVRAQQSLDLTSVSFVEAGVSAPGVIGSAVQAPPSVAATTARQAGVGTPWTSKPLRLSLFTSFAALQALDAASTMVAIRHGGVESNPMMGALIGHPAAFVGVKSASTVSTLLIMRRLSKEHPKAAILLASVLDGVYAAVVANNFRVAAR